MFKLFKIGIFIIIGLATSTSDAQIFSFQPNTTNASPTKDNQPTPALSAGDFKTKVATKSQQAQRELFQEAQSFKQQSGQLPLPNSPPKPPKLNNAPQSSEAPLPPAQNAKPASTPLLPPVEEDKTPPPVAATTTTTTTQTAPVVSQPTQTPTVTPSSAPTQSQIYTGFGAGSTPNNPSTTQPPKSGGWNIKY